jgi:hypothetical protein
MNENRDPHAERRRVFRQIERVFVYGPPIFALFVAVFGSLFLAFFVPIPGTAFWGRWFIFVLVLLVFPTIVYLVKDRLQS